MPELPEVEVVRRGLATHVAGRTVEAVELRGLRVARRHVPGPGDLAARVGGTRVVEVRRRGKYLWMVLAAGDAAPDLGLILHLGMSGQLLVEEPAAPDEKHLHARFSFVDGGPELRFVDQRPCECPSARFGSAYRTAGALAHHELRLWQGLLGA